MSYVRNPVVYVPDLTNGRPIVDGKVYLLTLGTIPPMHDSTIDPLDLLTVTFVNEAGNTVEQPQPLYTSKGGCLYGNFPDAARQFMIAPQAYVFAAYNRIGELQYSAETSASDYVETDDLAVVGSTVLVGGVEAGLLANNGILYATRFGAVASNNPADAVANTAAIQSMIDLVLVVPSRLIFIEDGVNFNLKSLVFSNDVDLEFRSNDELDSPSTFGQATNERIRFKNNDNMAGDVNEWQYAAALHPGIVLDVREDIPNRGAGTQAGLASHIIRSENINQWQWGRQTNGELAFTNWEYRYIINLGTSNFSVAPVVGNAVIGNTSGAEGDIIAISASSMTVSWRKGFYQVGETVTAGGNVSTSSIGTATASFTSKINRIVLAKNGLGAGANIPTANAIYPWVVGGTVGIENASGGSYGASKAGFRFYDNLASPTVGFRFALDETNKTLEIYDQAGTLLAELYASTGKIETRGGVYCTTGLGSLKPAEFTTAQLSSAAGTINTTAKARGLHVWWVTGAKPLWASGPNPTDVWVDATGATAVTPV